jgi:hypothetical protein
VFSSLEICDWKRKHKVPFGSPAAPVRSGQALRFAQDDRVFLFLEICDWKRKHKVPFGSPAAPVRSGQALRFAQDDSQIPYFSIRR